MAPRIEQLGNHSQPTYLSRGSGDGRPTADAFSFDSPTLTLSVQWRAGTSACWRRRESHQTHPAIPIWVIGTAYAECRADLWEGTIGQVRTSSTCTGRFLLLNDPILTTSGAQNRHPANLPSTQRRTGGDIPNPHERLPIVHPIIALASFTDYRRLQCGLGAGHYRLCASVTGC